MTGATLPPAKVSEGYSHEHAEAGYPPPASIPFFCYYHEPVESRPSSCGHRVIAHVSIQLQPFKAMEYRSFYPKGHHGESARQEKESPTLAG